MQKNRHDSIKDLLTATGFVNVQQLADKYGVTTETIRRDLEQFEKEGIVKRVRGGAVSTQIRTQQSDIETAFTLRKETNADEKKAIAKLAAELINDGDTVIIAPGTTSLETARCLRGKKDVTIITNSLPVAGELSDADGISVFCLGGFVRPDDYSVSGNMALDNLSMFNATKLITGVGGLSAENGLTDYRMDESSLLRKFFDNTKIAISVADHSKLGKVARYNICPASRIDILVTTDAASAEQIKPFEDLGVDVRIARM